MIDEKKLIEKMYDRYNGHYNDASKFYGEETEMANRVLSDLQETIEEMPKVGEWIPCSERLPKEEGWYIITRPTISGDYVEILSYGYAYESDKTMRFHQWDEEGYHCFIFADVTAWMPLPEPYKEEGTGHKEE